MFLIHPNEVAGWLDQRHPQSGVHVMEKVGGPAVPLWRWIEAYLTGARQPGRATLRRAVEEYRKEFPERAPQSNPGA